MTQGRRNADFSVLQGGVPQSHRIEQRPRRTRRLELCPILCHCAREDLHEADQAGLIVWTRLFRRQPQPSGCAPQRDAGQGEPSGSGFKVRRGPQWAQPRERENPIPPAVVRPCRSQPRHLPTLPRQSVRTGRQPPRRDGKGLHLPTTTTAAGSTPISQSPTRPAPAWTTTAPHSTTPAPTSTTTAHRSTAISQKS